MHTTAPRRRFPGIYVVTLGALRIAKVRTIARPSFGVLEALNPISKPQCQTIKCMIVDEGKPTSLSLANRKEGAVTYARYTMRLRHETYSATGWKASVSRTCRVPKADEKSSQF